MVSDLSFIIDWVFVPNGPVGFSGNTENGVTAPGRKFAQKRHASFVHFYLTLRNRKHLLRGNLLFLNRGIFIVSDTLLLSGTTRNSKLAEDVGDLASE